MAGAHEFWIAPHATELQPGQPIVAEFRIGEDLSGTAFPYIKERMVAFWIASRSNIAPLRPRNGNRPAVLIGDAEPGPKVIGYQSTPSKLTYQKPEKFGAFLAEEGLEGVLDLHQARGLPPAGFTEQFTRYAKALIHVGEPVAALPDHPTFRLDLTPLTGPRPHVFRLTWEGAVLGNHPVSILTEAGPRQRLFTDAQGRLTLTAPPNVAFLVSAVLMEPLEDDPEAVWHSHWASFYVGPKSIHTQQAKNEAHK
jgi:hypothetical protein